MTLRFSILLGLSVASSAAIGPAWATGSAIQEMRSTQGLRTNGHVVSDTGGTGIYNEAQRRKFGYGSPPDRVAPPR